MKKAEQLNLFGGKRLQMNESIALTADSLNFYGGDYNTWVIAWSGGKDSTVLLTLVLYLISSGKRVILTQHPSKGLVCQRHNK